MPEYRIYRMSQGHIIGPPQIFECTDEVDALEKAQQAVDGHDVELWDGPRLICRLPKNG